MNYKGKLHYAMRPVNEENKIIFCTIYGNVLRYIENVSDYEAVKEMFVRRWKSEYRNDEEELHWLLTCVNALPQEQEKDEARTIITLVDEDGIETEYEVLIIIEFEGKEYIALEDVNDRGLVDIARYHQTEGFS